MPFTNQDPHLRRYFDDIFNRLLKLENAKRFTAPNVTSDPTNPMIGDLWLNTTSNQLKVVDANGTVRVITWT